MGGTRDMGGSGLPSRCTLQTLFFVFVVFWFVFLSERLKATKEEATRETEGKGRFFFFNSQIEPLGATRADEKVPDW